MNRVGRGVYFAALVAVIVGLGGALASSQAMTRADLDQRFANRADLSGKFATSYVSDLVARERALAEDHLASPDVNTVDFARVVHDLGFEAAVLLDHRGLLLDVVPANPAIVGTVIAPRYAHLMAAESGRVGISGVVPGAATGRPVVGFATPFHAGAGTRVFSGAFDVGRTALGTYLGISLPYPGATADIIDESGRLVASSRRGASQATLREIDPSLARAVASSASAATFVDGANRRRFVPVHPDGTPWTLINSVSEAALYSPISSTAQWLPWVALAGLSVAGVYIVFLIVTLGDSRAELARTSLTDALTGLPNRRAWDIELPKELARALRAKSPLCLAIIDLDHFKDFNDRHGHPAGDELLVGAARSWSKQLREVDLLVRHGGEEFAILLPGASSANAAEIIDRIRQVTPGTCTASAGCAEWDGAETSEELVDRADRALYAAKAAGRNGTIVAASTPKSVGLASASGRSDGLPA